MKCKDCGEEKPSEEQYWRGTYRTVITRERSIRPDICDGCWDNRLKLMQAVKNGSLDGETFKKIQRAMSRGRGTAKRQIDKALSQ